MPARRSSDTDKEVGRRIKIRRLDLGFSQEKLGDALGVTFQQVQKYEKGVNRVSAGRLQQVAKILKVPVSFFFTDAGDKTAPDSEAFAMLDTAYSLRLIKAFTRIKHRRIQRSTVELVERIADAAGERGSRG